MFDNGDNKNNVTRIQNECHKTAAVDVIQTGSHRIHRFMTLEQANCQLVITIKFVFGSNNIESYNTYIYE